MASQSTTDDISLNRQLIAKEHIQEYCNNHAAKNKTLACELR